MKLSEVAASVRSNNAGALYVTFDIAFPDGAAFQAAWASGSINAEAVRRLYPFAGEDVRIFAFPPARVIKVTIPRPFKSGGPDERDFDGVQQHAPLLELEL